MNRLAELYPALGKAPDLDIVQWPLIELPGGTEVFTERDPCRGFPLVLAGSIKVVKSAPNGREMVLYRVESGGSCIISSSCLLGQSPYSARGVTESPTTLAILPVPQFQRLLADHPPFRDFVFHLFAERIAELMGLVEEVAFARLDRRLAKALLVRGSDEIETTHQQLAEELGSVREIVSRLLKGFAAEGLVQLSRERIRLVDRAGLQSLSLR